MLILFAFVFFRRHHAIVDSVRMKHYSAEVKEKEAQAPAGGCEGSQQYKNSDWDRTNHPEEARKFMSFVDVSQTGNDA